jgi:hypothetical protein
VEPSAGRLSARISPPSDFTMPWQIERPSPEPTPTGFVVKNGSKMRGRFSGAMPVPVSFTSTTTRPSPPGRTESRISFSDGWPSGIACAAFTSRLRSTCPIRCGLAATGGTSATSTTSRARWRISPCAIATEERIAPPTSAHPRASRHARTSSVLHHRARSALLRVLERSTMPAWAGSPKQRARA